MSIIASLSHRLEMRLSKAKWPRFLWLLATYLAMLTLAAIAIVVPITLLLNSLGFPPVQTPTDFGGLARRTVSEGLTIAVFAVGTWVWSRFLFKRDMPHLGLKLDAHTLKELGSGILAGIALTGVILVVAVLAGWIIVQGLTANSSPPFLLILASFVIANIKVAFTEELVFRGVLLQALEQWLGLPAAVIVASILFGMVHLMNPTATDWARFVIPFSLSLFGVMMALSYLLYDSLWFPIGFHFAWNLFEYNVFGLIGTSPQNPTILITEVTGPSFWVGLPGSAFGPEVGMLGTLVMVLAIGLLWWVTQDGTMRTSGKLKLRMTTERTLKSVQRE